METRLTYDQWETEHERREARKRALVKRILLHKGIGLVLLVVAALVMLFVPAEYLSGGEIMLIVLSFIFLFSIPYDLEMKRRKRKERR